MIDLQPRDTCEHLAQIGFAKLLHSPIESAARICQSATTADHLLVLERMLESAPKPCPFGEGVYWITRIDWPDRMPHLQTWTGQVTLPKLIKKYQSALREHVKQREKERVIERRELDAAIQAAAPDDPPQPPRLNPRDDLFSLQMPLHGASGLDAAAAPDPVDAGFSLHQTGMLVYQRIAVELLAIIGLQQVPLVSYGIRWCGFLHAGRAWQFRIEMRSGGYYSRWLSMSEVRV